MLALLGSKKPITTPTLGEEMGNQTTKRLITTVKTL